STLIRSSMAIVAVASLSARECDQLGVHRANIEALRRAIARLPVSAAYVLTDGFAVDGLGVPGLAMWKGDRVSASISAASIVAKVTRDQIMTRLHDEYPAYDFAGHKGYATPAHQGALRLHGPCSQHRYSYANVRQAVRGAGRTLSSMSRAWSWRCITNTVMWSNSSNTLSKPTGAFTYAIKSTSRSARKRETPISRFP